MADGALPEFTFKCLPDPEAVVDQGEYSSPALGEHFMSFSLKKVHVGGLSIWGHWMLRLMDIQTWGSQGLCKPARSLLTPTGYALICGTGITVFHRIPCLGTRKCSSHHGYIIDTWLTPKAKISVVMPIYQAMTRSWRRWSVGSIPLLVACCGVFGLLTTPGMGLSFWQ